MQLLCKVHFGGAKFGREWKNRTANKLQPLLVSTYNSTAFYHGFTWLYLTSGVATPGPIQA